MRLLTIVSAACLAMLVASSSAYSLLGAATVARCLVLGAGLSALSSGGSETVVVPAQAGSHAELVPAHHVIVQENVRNLNNMHVAHTITYSSSPISRLWGAVSSLVSAKAKAIGDTFRPNHAVVIVPQETTTTTPKPTTQKTHISIDIDGIDLHNHPNMHTNVILPGIEVLPGIRRAYPVMIDYVKK